MNSPLQNKTFLDSSFVEELSKEALENQGIDLKTYDLPHRKSSIEWWYLNAHVQNETGAEFSFFVSFFKLAVGVNPETGEMKFAYSVTWALSDVEGKKYYRDSIIDKVGPEVGLETLRRGKMTTDKRMIAAMTEILEKNQLPFPDRLAKTEAEVSWTSLNLDYQSNTLKVKEDGSYSLALKDEIKDIALTVTFAPKVKPIKHGDDGVVVGTSGEDMFYYFIPKNEVRGVLRIGDEAHVISGKGWYDHEFALEKEKTEVEVNLLHDIGWNWISLQISNGIQLTAYDLYDRLDHFKEAGNWAVLIKQDGTPSYPENFKFEPIKSWTSSKTFMSYPIQWRLQVPEYEIDLEVEAVFPEQEFISMLSEPAFWEGRINAKGRIGTEQVEAKGYVEVSGNAAMNTMESFLKAVTKETRKAVNTVLPLDPDEDKFIQMVASQKNSHFIKGLNKEQYIKQVITPIREIIDRGGKSWRSYAALACIDIVGGNSQDYLNWLAWPELLHTGSLIVDDIQDESTIRRGGPAAHIIHGNAIAINAGNAAYFLGQPLLLDANIPLEKKLKLYEIYFETMRAAHAGQAMDISSFYEDMDGIVQSGQITEIQEKVLCVHHLKSAVPAAMLARLGAVIGDASEEAKDHLSKFFEALGLAFQIMDDVLNLKGFEKNLKDKGEDIRAGKITMPVVMSMGRMDLESRTDLWNRIKAKPQDREEIFSLIELMEDCGAIQACSDLAAELVEDSWQKLQEHIQPSFSSLRLRAFSWFVLNRHY